MNKSWFRNTFTPFVLVAISLLPSYAFAGSDFIRTLQNVVDIFIGRILPVAALAFVGKCIFGHVTGNPNAKQETVQVVFGTAALLCVRGVWALIVQAAN